MKILTALVVALAFTALAACTPENKDVTGTFKLPEGLSDCTIYDLKSTNASSLTVVRCPNSKVSTSYAQGKAMKYVATQEIE